MYSSSDLWDLCNEILGKFDIRAIDDDILGLVESVPRKIIPNIDDKRSAEKLRSSVRLGKGLEKCLNLMNLYLVNHLLRKLRSG